jgi:hypothetical protein
MRVILLVLCAVFAAAEAHAKAVVVMTERSAELGAALEVALASRHLDISRSRPPGGELRLDRAAAAQRAALDAGADAAVWIDMNDVCAVSADGSVFRHAPIDEVSPRMFAAIATSLIDEVLTPGMLNVTVDVNVNIAPPGAPAPGTPAPAIAPTPQPDAVAYEAPRKRLYDARALLEFGGMMSPLTTGFEANVMFPITTSFSVGVMGALNVTMFEDEDPVLIRAGAIEVRHTRSGRRHFDLGWLAGYATDGEDPVRFIGARLGYTWELGDEGRQFSLVPMLIFTGTSDAVLPGIYASYKWMIQL